jgi:hypothetical protein
MNIIYKYIFLILLVVYTSYSQNEVKIPEVITSRGEKILLPITGTIQKSGLTEITLLLTYDYFMLDIRAAIGSESFGMKSGIILNKYWDASISAYRLSIYSNDVQEINNGTLCLLDIEILAGEKEIAQIIPDSLFLNGNLENTTFQKGIIKISDPPVVKNYPEGLGLNFPNPVVNNKTTFPFIIEKKSQVYFYFYNTAGRLVLSNENYIDEFKIFYIPEGAEIKEKAITDKLEQGQYQLVFTPKPIYFATGAYFLVMKTNNGVYYRNFMILR